MKRNFNDLWDYIKKKKMNYEKTTNGLKNN